LRLIDEPKFLDPIENLKYVGKKIEPTFKYESGIIDKKDIEFIIDFVKTLAVKPCLGKGRGIILDGTYYTLEIGVESIKTIYKWHDLPDDWTALEKLAAMLEELNLKL
jgi:hypothetical protein